MAGQSDSKMSLKDMGNEYFKAGQFKEAEELYTQSIASFSRDPKVFANRALTRIRLQDWSNAESDSRKAMELYGPKKNTSMKAHYYLAQSLLPRRHVTEALKEAQTAYHMCLETRDASAEVISQFVLRAKQAIWQAKESARLRDLSQTLALVEDLLENQLKRDLEDVETRFAKGELGATGRTEEIKELEHEAEQRRTDIRVGFRVEGKPETTERVVPDYLIDTITFEVMHDPVITPSGVSYERVGILKHIRAVGHDPLTREPLTESQLISNVALKNACSEFLENNGWAIDF